MANNPVDSFKSAPINKYRLAIECRKNYELKRGRGYDPEAENIADDNNQAQPTASDTSDLIHLDLYRKRDNHFIKRLLSSNTSSIKQLNTNLSFEFDDLAGQGDSQPPMAVADIVIVASFTDSNNNPLAKQSNITLDIIDSDNLSRLSGASGSSGDNPSGR